ncbi:MAG: hypothetical protein ACTHOD_04320 [Motilibacteraceae bacterium]
MGPWCQREDRGDDRSGVRTEVQGKEQPEEPVHAEQPDQPDGGRPVPHSPPWWRRWG